MACSRVMHVYCLAMSVPKDTVTQHHISEKAIPHFHCCENLKTCVLDNGFTSQKY